MTDLERRALLGDRGSQRIFTQLQIPLPCPWCKKAPAEDDVCPDFAGWIIYHDCKIAGRMRIKAKTRFDLILKWNTRPAPPIGRCKDCRYRAGEFDENGYSICIATRAGITQVDFCSRFEPKED